MESVAFFSEGLQLVGDLYLPAGSGDAPVPAVVLCAGWVGGRYHRADAFASVLNAHGVALLAFEYRGWGRSAGDRTRLYPQEHAVDARAAVAYLQQRPEVDRDRIVLLGKEHGAGVALQAASEDPSIAAVACLFPIGDGARWMRAIRRPWEWREFEARVVADRVRRSVEGTSTLIDPFDVLLVDPHTAARREEKRARDPEFASWRIGLDSADALLAFRPEDHVHRIAPRPVLCIAVEDDNTIPIEEAMAVFERIPGPKQMLVLRGIEHYDAYRPVYLDPVLDRVAALASDGRLECDAP